MCSVSSGRFLITTRGLKDRSVWRLISFLVALLLSGIIESKSMSILLGYVLVSALMRSFLYNARTCSNFLQ